MKTMKADTAVLLSAVLEFLKALIPGTIGAAVAVSFNKSKSLGQKVLQFVVGIVVSYYAAQLTQELTSWGPYAVQAVSFTVGLVAYEAIPSFMKSSAETAGSIPRDLWAFVKKKLGIGEAAK